MDTLLEDVLAPSVTGQDFAVRLRKTALCG